MKEKEIKRSFLKISKRFLEPLKSNKIIALKSFIKMIFRGINPISHIFFIQKIVYQIEHKNYESFKLIFIYYILYIIIYEISELIMIKWGWYGAVESYKKSINEKYILKYIKLNNNSLEKIGTGKLISIVEKGVEIWGIWLNFFIENIVQISVVLLFSVYVIFKFSNFYGLLFLLIYIFLIILGNVLNKKMIFYRNKRKDSQTNYTRQFVKIIMSKFEIMQTGKISKETIKLNNYADEMIFYNFKMVPFIHPFFRLPMLIMTLFKVIIIFFLGNSIFSGENDLSLLVAIFGILTLMDTVIYKSIIFFKDFTKEFVHITRLWDFFDTTPEIQGYEEGKEFEYKTGSIELQNITFGYEENKKVFKDFNLKLNGGKITAFVGNSGGGKTTLVKIISQYIKQDSGKLIIDGQDLNEISLKSYYKNIGYLTQEPSVFDGTILDNLTYALEENTLSQQQIPLSQPFPPGEKGVENSIGKDVLVPSPLGGGLGRGMQEKIHKIITLSKCEFIYEFEKGLETEIGERGVRLSGGQKQRLAIAKIILKDPKIIILDEPTSALDSFSEELITKAMNNLFEGRTVLVIAHRLQTVKHADEIIVIENGEIQERGKHTELVEKNGIYNRMLELQSGF